MAEVETTTSGAHVRTINGGRYARSRGRLYRLGEDVPRGHIVRALGVLDTTAEGARVPILADLTPDDEGAMERLTTSTGAIPFDPYEPDALRQEIERLEAQGFVAVAASARLANAYEEPAPLGSLDLGQVRMSPRALEPVACQGIMGYSCNLAPTVLPFSTADVRALLKRHANYDHGDFGKAADVVLSDDMRWAPPVFGWEVRNAVAIEAGRGLVRSCYGVDVAPRAKAAPGWDASWSMRPQIVHLSVATLIGRCTVIWPDWINVGF